MTDLDVVVALFERNQIGFTRKDLLKGVRLEIHPGGDAGVKWNAYFETWVEFTPEGALACWSSTP